MSAVLSIVFLFNTGNSMWGANIPSTLAGEFAYSLGFALLWMYFGFLYDAVVKKRSLVLPILLLFVVGLSHVYALLVAVGGTFFFFLLGLFTYGMEHFQHHTKAQGISQLPGHSRGNSHHPSLSRRSHAQHTQQDDGLHQLHQRLVFRQLLATLVVLLLVAGLLLSLFYLPLAYYLPYTTAYADHWEYSFKELFPSIFTPFLVLGLVGVIVFLGFLGILLLEGYTQQRVQVRGLSKPGVKEPRVLASKIPHVPNPSLDNTLHKKNMHHAPSWSSLQGFSLLLSLPTFFSSMFLPYSFSEAKRKVHVFFFLIWIGVVCLLLSFFAVRLGVVNIRFLPFVQLLVLLLSVLWLALLPQPKKYLVVLITIVFVLGSLSFVSTSAEYIPFWIAWNYEGFEHKPYAPLFAAINHYLSPEQMQLLDSGSNLEPIQPLMQSPTSYFAAIKEPKRHLQNTSEAILLQLPRVVFEHSSKHNLFGSTRAFESLPLFAHRATLEGLYMQSSLHGPFVFYLQSLYSEEISCPFPNYGCSTINFARALPYLNLYAVQHLILVSPHARKQALATPGYHELTSFSAGNLTYSIVATTTTPSYLEVPAFMPVIVPKTYSTHLAFFWFLHESQLSVPLVFVSSSEQKALEHLYSTLLQQSGNLSFAGPALARRNASEGLVSSFFVVVPQFAVDSPDEALALVQQVPKKPLIVPDHCTSPQLTFAVDTLTLTNLCVGVPYLLKVSYFPKWKTSDAVVLHATPSFMLLVPKHEKVTVTYKSSVVDSLGFLFFLLGVLGLLLLPDLLGIVLAFFAWCSKHKTLVLFLLALVVVLLSMLVVMVALSKQQTFYYQHTLAVALGSYRACDYAGPYRDACLIAVAKKTGDVNLCAVEVRKKNKDECFLQAAVAHQQKQWCFWIRQKEKQHECLSFFS
ncbi:MAG: 6-pyruvoyl-tetrahydropterin synthase-related protein [Candidatus Woesearchaeota archaeon]